MCKAVREWRTMLITQGEAKGLKRGEAKGFKKGEEKGFKKGEAKLIVTMLSRNASPRQVHELTGISLKRIRAIAAESPITLGKAE